MRRLYYGQQSQLHLITHRLLQIDPGKQYKDQTWSDNLLKAREQSKKCHDITRKRKAEDQHPQSFAIGDQVLVKTKNKTNRKKLEPLYDGPFEIEKQLS